MTREGLKTSQVKIMSQYKAQKFAIQEALKPDFYDAEVNTVVACQGKRNQNPPFFILIYTFFSQILHHFPFVGGEWDYVIFSTVRSLPAFRIEPYPTLGWCSQNLGFIRDPHQINVALTRARKGIIIIGRYFGSWFVSSSAAYIIHGRVKYALIEMLLRQTFDI